MKPGIARVAVLLLCGWHVASAYSVLTHEAIIDAVWDTHLKPLLLKRFPDLTPEQLRQAHAQSYGGAIVQDMGYYPFGSKLERAFEDTYSLKLTDVFRSLDLALSTYRHTVSSIIPEMTKAAWAAKKNDIAKLQPGMTRRKYIYNLKHASYVKEWGADYEKPGCGARLVASLFRLVPKVGPFRALSFKPPTPQVEKLFMASFNDTLDQYRQLLAEVRDNQLRLSNTNFDTGKPTSEGKYKLADQTYAALLEKLADTKAPVSEPLRADILAFYKDPGEITSQKARGEYDQLRVMTK